MPRKSRVEYLTGARILSGKTPASLVLVSFADYRGGRLKLKKHSPRGLARQSSSSPDRNPYGGVRATDPDDENEKRKTRQFFDVTGRQRKKEQRDRGKLLIRCVGGGGGFFFRQEQSDDYVCINVLYNT